MTDDISTPSETPPAEKETVIVAGATGFVGRSLVQKLSERFRVVGLTRNAERAARNHGDLPIDWVECDLYSLSSVREALRGAEFAVYLVHSMLPVAGLTQASFEDLDVLLADNFARAAAENGVKQISYLGGLIPRSGKMSAHLASRLEVEKVLGGRGVPTTVLRAGLVIGGGGSSFRILRLLVSRLPVMVLPSWTSTRTTPISLEDVVDLLARSVGDPECLGITSDVGSPDTVTYRRLLELTAKALGSARPMVGVPLLTPKLSALWVNLVTGSPRELVWPLIRSLECEMIAEEKVLQERWSHPGKGVEESVEKALALIPARKKKSLAPFPRAPRGVPVVRSVQRLPHVEGKSVSWMADEYGHWLTRAFSPFLKVERDDGSSMRIVFRPLNLTMIEMQRSSHASRPDRETLEIVGGALVRKSTQFRGRLEFREVKSADCVIAGLHDFTPRLPWFFYRATQARIHLRVMHAFGRHLEKISRKRAAS